MKVKNITIENYRSIKEEVVLNVEIIARMQAFMLLGINESGKSNILEAIALLDKERDFNYGTDCHSKNEDEGKDIVISYELEIKNVIESYRELFSKDKIPKKLSAFIDITQIERKIKIDSDNNRIDFYHIWIKDKKKEFSEYVIVDDSVTLEDGTTKAVKKIVEKTSENIKVDADGNEENVLDKDKLENFLEEEFFSLFDFNIPKVIFWKYEDRYLIKDKVNLEEFKTKTDLSTPLKNCFAIAGIKEEDIESRIDSISGNSTKKSKLTKLLGDKVTEHINKIWKEHKVKIEFDIDTMQLSFHVKDSGDELESYGVAQRSDGFKHFVSILLNLSAENEVGELKNKLIILDEPEIHLHPSGEKYLRDELLNISRKNLVILATHSIFMVDKGNLDRHYSVEKEGVETGVHQIERDNPFREEVLYESLGTSILEHVENKVLLFEGKTDRDIFDLYKKKFKKDIKLPNMSLFSADGVENIIKYTKFFNNKLVEGFVLVDSDDDGVAQKEKVLGEDNYNKNNTFEINDVLNTKKQSTLEDLFDKKYLLGVVSEVFENLSVTIDDKKPYLEQVRQHCKDNNLYVNKKTYQQKEKEIKKIFFKKISKLNKEELEKEKYHTFLKEIQKKLLK